MGFWEASMQDEHFTREQQEKLEERARDLGEDGIRSGEQAWAELIGEVEAERAAGTPPTDPRVQALAGRWLDLVQQFTGGDEGIRSSLEKTYRREGPEAASRGMVGP